MLDLGMPATSFTSAGSGTGSLITGVTPSGNALVLRLRDSAFGYVFSRPDPRRIRVDVFPDPLGARWKGSERSRLLQAVADPKVGASGDPAVGSGSEVQSQAASTVSPEREKTPAVPEISEPPVQSVRRTDRERSTEKRSPASATETTSVRSDPSRPQEESAPVRATRSTAAPVPTPDTSSDNSGTGFLRDNRSKAMRPASNSLWNDARSVASGPSAPQIQEPPAPAFEEAPHTSEPSQGSGDAGGDVEPLQEPVVVEAESDGAGTAGDPKNGEVDASLNTYRGKIASTDSEIDGALGAEAAPGRGTPTVQEGGSDNSTSAPETDAEGSAEGERSIIYVDEQGNEVPKPPDVPTLLSEARQQAGMLQFESAREKLEELKNCVLTPEQREEVLYLYSDVLDGLYKTRPLEGFKPVTDAAEEAMNFNPESARVPRALYRLGKINLLVGNQPEALGYFGVLRQQYPTDPDVPKAYVEVGRDQLNKQQYAEAVDNFRLVLDEYPESNEVRDASRYMAEALYRQGHYDRAQILVDFVDRRWPRLHLDDPAYLPLVADIYDKSGNYPLALQTYWTYYNLLPDNPDNHVNLLAVGSIYLKMGLNKGAHDVFERLLRSFPESSSAPTAVLRMGEDRLSEDNPELDELFELFSRPGISSPEAAYRRILASWPESAEAETAALRLAAAQYWNKDTDEAMQGAEAFLNAYPSSELVPRAEELILRGFRRETAMALEEENYERILALWERYPQIPAAHPEPDDELRVALARAKLNRGDEKAGLDMLAGFLERPKAGKYGEYVYNLFLARHLREEDWRAVLDLGDKVAAWTLPSAVRDQLDYSLAVSAENLGLSDRALAGWKKLHRREEIPLYQRAYATYFLARDAERRRSIREAYELNLEALNLFTELENEQSDKADPERIRESMAALMDVAEVAGRFAEALEWSEKYAPLVPDTSPDYAALLFRRARLHRKMGDLTHWRSLLEQIVAREPDSVFGRMAASELHTQEVARDITRFAPAQEDENSPPAPAP